jgi:hypothetical protein
LPLNEGSKAKKRRREERGRNTKSDYIYRGPTRVVLPGLVSGRTRTISAGEGRESKIKNCGRGAELEVYYKTESQVHIYINIIIQY